MTVEATAHPRAGRSDPTFALLGPPDETMLLALPPLLVAAAILSLHENGPELQLRATVPALVLLLWPVVFFLSRRLGYLASAWTLVCGYIIGIGLVVGWSQVPAALHLLALPAGLAALLIGSAGGLAVASAASLLLLVAPPSLLPVSAPLRLTTAFGTWGTVGLVWLATRQLAVALQWSWASYLDCRSQLERARDHQVQAKQTLEDLAAANLQLTRLNRLAQALRQAAEEAFRAKEQFVANVSHELRTPLNMIVGFSEMILGAPQAYGKIPPTLLADLAVIARNSQHLASLIDDVLDLSQIETGHMALSRERVPLREIVDGAVVAVRPLYASKKLYLETEVPEGAAVFCDRTRIREVVLNLLSNAGRFTEQGGVCLRAWQEAGDLVVSVSDTGPGIAAEEEAKLFRPFQQLDDSLRRRFGGTGLGLAISKSFVELHGGRMWLESQKGKGTTFFFSLPIDPPAAVDAGVSRWFNPHWHYEERTRRSLAPVPVLRPRFLVLEEGNTLQRLVSRYLDGAEIVPVATLEEAVRQLSRVPAQAVLANGRQGSDALASLRETAGLPYGTPLIACSLPELSDAAGALGVAGYLVKPITRDALLSALDRLRREVKTILVVDDEPEALQLFKRMLASAERGYQVRVAANGAQALRVLRQERPDVVLLDLVMPEMDGFRVLETRAGDPALQDVPFIVISARDPAGEPIVSDSLAVTRGGGLSASQLLMCIEAIGGILGTAGQQADPAPQADRSG